MADAMVLPDSLRRLSLLAATSLVALSAGCAAESGSADRPTASLTAAFTDGSTYAADGDVTITREAGDDGSLRFTRRLVEPTTGDELDLALTVPTTGAAGHDELDVDADLTLVRSKAKKTVRVHVTLDDFARSDRVVSGRLTLKSVDTASPILAGSVDLERQEL
jgi:hypothetical protein